MTFISRVLNKNLTNYKSKNQLACGSRVIENLRGEIKVFKKIKNLCGLEVFKRESLGLATQMCKCNYDANWTKHRKAKIRQEKLQVRHDSKLFAEF